MDYYNSWGEQEEQKLYELLKSTPAKFILSTWHGNQYRTNPAIEKYAYSFTVLTREHFYHVGASEKNRNPMLEAIVLNYNPLTPIDLQEEKQLSLLEKKQKEEYILYSTPSV